MKYFIVFLALLYVVDGRNLFDKNEEQDDEFEDGNDYIKSIRDHASKQVRHRRKARRTYYDFYDNNDIRDYPRHQDETLTKIERLLDEISWYIKRPQAPLQPATPPQPQIIYVPYPVPYPVPQYANDCVNLTKRWPQMEDKNQNWGIVVGNTGEDIDDGKDGAKDISFDVVEPEEPIPAPPQVEHGSTQAGKETTPAPPGICQAAIILCCNLGTKTEQRNCFYKYKCPKTFSTGLSCNPDVVQNVFEAFEKTYALN